MEQAFFCREAAAGGTSGGALYAVLILGAFALWFAVRSLERGDLRGFLRGMRGVWASWSPALRMLMAVLCAVCAVYAQKPSGANRAAGGETAAETVVAIPAQTDTGNPTSAQTAGEPVSAQTAGDTAAQPLGGGGGLRTLWTLEDGTNCWWVAEGRDPADTDGDGMPDAWERLFGLDPLDPSDAASDHDRDGLTALEEFLNRTHPRRRDTDGDGMPDAWEAANLPHLCPWLPDDAADADGDGLDNFQEHALGCDPVDPDTNGDGRPDGEEAGEGVDAALSPPDWAAYGTALLTVRVEGLRAARRAGVSVGHVTHSGVAGRTYALAAGYRYPLTVTDLDPDSPDACSGTVRITHDNATFLHGFTNEFPVSFPLDPAAPACPLGAEVTVVGIDLGIPDITWVSSGGVADFPVAARFVPDDESIAGTPHWAVSGGSASPASGGMETWVTVTFPEPAARAPLDAGIETNSPPSVTVEVGDRKVTREVYPPVVPDPEDPDPWDNRRFIARSPDDEDPVELTYALAHGTNAVPFAWRGQPGDTVLEWTFSKDGPRFLKDGQETRTVTHAQSVSVLPKGSIDNFEITAKVLMAGGGTVTRQTELRVVTIVAKAVHQFYPGGDGQLVNPSGFCVGGKATFRIEFSENMKDSDISWMKYGEGITDWDTGSEDSGKGDIILLGVQPGSGGICGLVNRSYGFPNPRLDFKVFAVPTPIPVHVGILCDTNGAQSATLSEITQKITLASKIYRQVGIDFTLASVTCITNQGFYLSDPQTTPNYLDTNALIRTQIQQSDGLEVYFCPWDVVQLPGASGTWDIEGILIAKNKPDDVLAHEIGHAIGWDDIYREQYFYYNNTLIEVRVEGPTSQDRLPLDWNNGPGPEEYYPRGMEHAQVIDTLLMSSLNGVDIPAGRVYGVPRPRDGTTPRLIKVGEVDVTTRYPISQ